MELWKGHLKEVEGIAADYRQCILTLLTLISVYTFFKLSFSKIRVVARPATNVIYHTTFSSPEGYMWSLIIVNLDLIEL